MRDTEDLKKELQARYNEYVVILKQIKRNRRNGKKKRYKVRPGKEVVLRTLSERIVELEELLGIDDSNRNFKLN